MSRTNTLKDSSPLKYFCKVLIGLLAAHLVLHWLRNYSSSYQAFTNQLIAWNVALQVQLMELAGFTVIQSGAVVAIEGSRGVIINEGCLGIQPTLLMLIFILAYPTSQSLRIKFALIIPLILQILNTLRITMVIMATKLWPNLVSPLHELILPAIYVSIALALLHWITRSKLT